MDMNNSADPSQSGPTELNTDRESVDLKREPPPPYTSQAITTEPSIIHQTVIIQPPLKHMPIFYHCHKCQERVLTEVKYVNSNKTHLFAGFICGFTLWCLLCCLSVIPYLTNSCKEAQHYCPNCKTLLGTSSRF